MMRSKYNATKTVYDGIRFDSKREACRYIELKQKLDTGQIQALELQVPFILLDGYVLEGKKVRPITYKADFVYVADGVTIVEDSKGFITKDFALKKKMFESRYGKLTLTK
jgi:hypothetical protein